MFACQDKVGLGVDGIWLERNRGEGGGVLVDGDGVGLKGYVGLEVRDLG